MVRSLFAAGFGLAAGCYSGHKGMRDDDILTLQDRPVVLPRPITTQNNAFVSHGLLAPSDFGEEPLHKTLAKFAEDSGEELCYWSYQSLPPPKGGPTMLHPERKPWDLQSGEHDQDLEWVQAYQQVAVSRLHSMIRPDGPVVGAISASGREQAQRRCASGRASDWQCEQRITESNMSWPMAIAIFKVGHPDLEAAIGWWRGNGSAHLPNINWASGAGTQPLSTYPWNHGGSLPKAGDVDPEGMPHGPTWPVSKDGNVLLGHTWGEGGPMIAKVVRCSDIPSKFVYSKQLYYTDHVVADAEMSSADEGYAAWSSLTGVWPPTESCHDDVATLNAVFPGLNASSCAVGMTALSEAIENFDCDYSLSFPLVRSLCCSVCGGAPVPVPPPAPAPTPAEKYQCTVCAHEYNATEDGDGFDFADLPDSWVCPVCGAPKSAYENETSMVLV